MTNNDLQNIRQKTKDRVTRTPLKTGKNIVESGVKHHKPPTTKSQMENKQYHTSDI
jgi:hypothetical protein